jgi:tRNA(Ile)-lysidine synthase
MFTCNMPEINFVHEKVLTKTFMRHLEDQKIKRLVVGLSGGVDSVVLLDIVSEIKEFPISVVHVNHHLHSRSDDYEKFCMALGEKYQFEVYCQSVKVSVQGSLEARAREARYNVFERYLIEGDLLLLAHHADDQLETVLFRLFRGGRVLGLEGMPATRALGKASLHRPMLGITRTDIEKYASERKLSWCEDPTNVEVDADRNYIRHNIMPVIHSRFPGAKKALLAGLGRDLIARGQLNERLSGQLKQVRHSLDGLKLDLLRLIRQDELVLLLTQWLDDLNQLQPSGRMLLELAGNILNKNRIYMAAGELEFRDLDNVIYVLRQLPPMEFVSCSLGDFEFPGGCVSNNVVKGEGLRASSGYKMVFRSGKEKIRMGKNRDIKKIFQESRVPSWIRDRVPLVYAGGELVAIAAVPNWKVSMKVADGWLAGPEESGFGVSLSLADRVLT